MVSRGNAVPVGFVLLALGLACGELLFTGLPDTTLSGILILVGVVTPLLVIEYPDRRDDGGG